MLILAAAPMLWACSADEGAMPGSDPNPVVTLYSYAPTDEDSNPDNDVMVRFATNDKVTSVKYLLLPSEQATALSEAEMIQKVSSEGTEVANLGANGTADVTFKDIYGPYVIAAVANGSKLGNTISFTGLSWTVFKTGTFYYGVTFTPSESVEATLEKCDTDDTLYRISGVFGAGTAFKCQLLDVTGEDELGKFHLFRVPQADTPWTYGSYGTVFVEDVGYWQGNSAYVTGFNGFENYFYDNGYIDVCLAWMCSAGCIDYKYGAFVPAD